MTKRLLGLVLGLAICSALFHWATARAVAIGVPLVSYFVIVPTVMLSGTLVDSAKGLATHLSADTLNVPPPPPQVAGWPLIGEPLARFWHLASTNLQGALGQVGPQLKDAATWLLSRAARVSSRA